MLFVFEWRSRVELLLPLALDVSRLIPSGACSGRTLPMNAEKSDFNPRLSTNRSQAGAPFSV